MKPIVIVIAAALALACPPAAAQLPTPTVRSLETLEGDDGETLSLIARATVGGSVVGFALAAPARTCW